MSKSRKIRKLRSFLNQDSPVIVVGVQEVNIHTYFMPEHKVLQPCTSVHTTYIDTSYEVLKKIIKIVILFQIENDSQVFLGFLGIRSH